MGDQKKRTAAALMATPCDQWQMDDLRAGVGVAIELELATLPPYLCGMWSISDPPSSEAPTLIKGVYEEEMLHMGLMCNLLAGIGGTFDITAPVYPGGLPRGIRPDLTVTLSGLTKAYVSDVYMQIEYPESGPILTDEATPTIGAFYDCISAGVQAVNPSTFDTTNQQTATIGPEPGCNEVFVIDSVALALKAIEEIKEQGEGTSQSPDAVDEGGELAHYYRFGELYHGKAFVQGPDGKWDYTGAEVPWPKLHPVAAVPAGGWPDPVPTEITDFRVAFATLLENLQAAWTGKGTLGDAIDTMFTLHNLAPQIVQIPLPDGSGLTYLPDFRTP